mmetsp:Transcript_26201/g.40185  ORF Transcript_26201/g.40185 Transcript_26201/m.40185 type:complete len:539 (+) Transcript_26201:294-1910(+)
MDEVLVNDDLMRLILGYVIPKCQGGNDAHHTCTNPVENRPGELLSFGVSRVMDNGTTCLRKCARVAFQIRFVSLRWNNLVQDVVQSERLPGPAMFLPKPRKTTGSSTTYKIPFVCGGEADLRRRVAEKLEKRRKARSLLSIEERDSIDQDLESSTWSVLQFCGRRLASRNDLQDQHNTILPTVQNILRQLDRGASTDKFLLIDPIDDTSWYFTDIFRFYEHSIEKAPPFLWVILQEIACAAGNTRAIPSCIDRSNGDIPLPFFQLLIDLVGGYLDISPFVKESPRNPKRRVVVRRLGLGLARIILHVSALDHLEKIKKTTIPINTRDLCNLISGDPYNLSWSQVWLNRCVLISPLDAAIDHRFSFELLGCVAVNGLGGTILPPDDGNTEAIEKYYDFKDWPFRMHSYMFLRYLHLGLKVFSDVQEFINTLSVDSSWIKQERLEFGKFVSNVIRREDMVLTFKGNSKITNWIVSTACGMELIKELICLKQYGCLRVLMKKESPHSPLQSILPELIQYAKSKTTSESNDQIVFLLQSFRK